jgi:DNA-binding response OmpR family regulator
MNDPARPSILIVEDEPLLALDLEATLAEGGFRVIGPTATTSQAIELVREHRPDLTILDLNLGREWVFPVADVLTQLGLRFFILSGHSRDFVPARHRNSPFMQKPHSAAALLRKVRAMLGSAGQSSVCIA